MTFLSRRKRPTTAALATRLRPTATRALVLAAALLAGAKADAQQSRPAMLQFSPPATPLPAQTQPPPIQTPAVQPIPTGVTPEFKTLIFTRAPGDERTNSVVAPDEASPIVRVGAQIQSSKKIYEEDADFQIRTDLPGPERLFDTRKSEDMMREYIRRDSTVRTGSARIIFPEYPPLTTEPFAPRQFARSTTLVEPGYVCHGRLYFEQKNLERAGWDLGYLTPGLGLAGFYYDLALLPYHSWTNPCVCYDCSAGKCQPGDATPFYLYREEFSLSGLAGQALFMGGGFFIFP